jgi:EF-hand domain pair
VDDISVLIAQAGDAARDWGYTYTDFLSAAMLRRVSFDEHQLILAFSSLDIEHKGYLTRADVLNVLGRTGIDDDVKALFHEIDGNEDDKIEYFEFVKYLRRELFRLKVTPLQHLKTVMSMRLLCKYARIWKFTVLVRLDLIGGLFYDCFSVFY